MEPEFALTPMEIIFFLVAVVATLPIIIFIKWILKELKKEQNSGND